MGKDKADLLPGTLDLLVLKTVETMGPIHGWGIAKRIEQVSQDLLEMKYGTLYPALMKLEQNGWIEARRRAETVINNCDAPIRRLPRLLRQKIGRSHFRMPKSPSRQ